MNPTTSFWDQHGLSALVRSILAAVPADPHKTAGTGRMFLTTYQIVIEIERQQPAVVTAYAAAFPPGGAGTGPHAFTKYLAQNLSRLIRSGAVTDAEMRFLAGDHLTNISFDNEGEPMEMTTKNRVTMFRLV